MKSKKGKSKSKNKKLQPEEEVENNVEKMKLIFDNKIDNSNMKNLLLDNYQVDHENCYVNSHTQFLNLLNIARSGIVTAYFNNFDYFSIIIEKGLAFIKDKFKVELEYNIEKYANSKDYKFYFYRCTTEFYKGNELGANLSKTLVTANLNSYPNALSSEIELIINSIEDYSDTMLKNNIENYFKSCRNYFKLLLEYNSKCFKLPIFCEDFSEKKEEYLKNIYTFVNEKGISIRQFSYLHYFIIAQIPLEELASI